MASGHVVEGQSNGIFGTPLASDLTAEAMQLQ
jgi:hypothetical protein